MTEKKIGCTGLLLFAPEHFLDLSSSVCGEASMTTQAEHWVQHRASSLRSLFLLLCQYQGCWNSVVFNTVHMGIILILISQLLFSVSKVCAISVQGRFI